MSLLLAYEALGSGGIPDTRTYKPTVHGLQEWLDVVGVRFFSAIEACQANHFRRAADLGYTNGLLVPPTTHWPALGATLLLADVCRSAVNPRPGPPGVKLRNAWRPEDYNAAVGGAADSDHIYALGVDLDFKREHHARLAEGAVRALHDRIPDLGLSLGVGRRTLHVGLLTDRGTRTWAYDVYKTPFRRLFTLPLRPPSA